MTFLISCCFSSSPWIMTHFAPQFVPKCTCHVLEIVSSIKYKQQKISFLKLFSIMFFFFLSRNVSQLKLSPIISSANSLYMSASVSISSVHDIGNVMRCDSQFFAQIACHDRSVTLSGREWQSTDLRACLRENLPRSHSCVRFTILRRRSLTKRRKQPCYQKETRATDGAVVGRSGKKFLDTPLSHNSLILVPSRSSCLCLRRYSPVIHSALAFVRT